MDLSLFLEQRQQLSQSQIQSLEILSMDNMELSQFLKNEYLENPLLDHTETENSNTNTDSLTSLYEKTSGNGFDLYTSSNDDNNCAPDFSAPFENVIEEYLLNQLNRHLYTAQEWELFKYMIGCLDDNGYFTMPVTEVSDKFSIPLELVAHALITLQELEPYGIFSTNLQNCLLRQLDALDINTEILTQIILCHLEDIANGKISAISRHLNIPTVNARKCIELISRLNPRPLSRFNTGTSHYIIPDIIIEKDFDHWSIHLNDSWVEDYHLNDYYLNMMKKSSDEELVSYFSAKLKRVRFILQSIEQRRKTILSISEIILDKQTAFFLGDGPLTPMTMSAVAEKANINVSTVSRAIKNKYIQYPNGSIFAKNLFATRVSSQSHGNITPMLVKQYIKEYIEAENKEKPYSDQSLVALLNERNIKVSRRVVAKYREELGIKGSFDRRCF